MSVCPACMAEGWSPGVPCPSCGKVSSRASGAMVIPDLELDVPAPQKPKPVVKKAKIEEAPLELAVDLGGLRSDPPPSMPPASGPRPSGAGSVSAAVSMRPMKHGSTAAASPSTAAAPETEVEFEARALANYGDAPKHWYQAPSYAYRVWKRQGELRHALVARREEASHAKTRAEDALVACGERVRAHAPNDPQYQRALADLKAQDDVLRSRDASLAKEQDAHTERLAAIDERVVRLETELAAAKSEERLIADELTELQKTLERAEAKMKRAEIEIRSANAARDASRPGT